MALRDAVLAALLDGEASGYDLAKGFDASVANFWMATPQQLYRELDRMAAEGLIAARLIEQDRRPNKRLYSLTDQGRQALLEYTALPPKPGAIREDLLVQVQAVDTGNIEAVRDALAERRQWAAAKLARYHRVRGPPAGRTHRRGVPGRGRAHRPLSRRCCAESGSRKRTSPGPGGHSRPSNSDWRRRADPVDDSPWWRRVPQRATPTDVDCRGDQTLLCFRRLQRTSRPES